MQSAVALGAIVAKTGAGFSETAMRDYLFILLGTALVNNVVLARFLGLCPFMGVSNKVDSALGMAWRPPLS